MKHDDRFDRSRTRQHRQHHARAGQIDVGSTSAVEIETATHAKTQAVPIQSVVVRAERESLDRIAPHIAALTAVEGLASHGEAVARRVRP